MAADLGDLTAFVAVARAGGFRDAARTIGSSASSLSEAVRRLETKLGVRLLNRTTRSVAPTEAGARLLDRLGPALVEVEAALDVVNGFRDRPAGTLRLNVPIVAARLVLPPASCRRRAGASLAAPRRLACRGAGRARRRRTASSCGASRWPGRERRRWTPPPFRPSSKSKGGRWGRRARRPLRPRPRPSERTTRRANP